VPRKSPVAEGIAMIAMTWLLADVITHADGLSELAWFIECARDQRCHRCGYKLATGRHVPPWVGHDAG